MPEGLALEFSGVTKRFGAITAVSDLSARVESGRVTGFLGPNGAGKTTSLRILLGLVQATEGTATIGGVPYAKLDRPLQTVGAVLEASSFHPGRTAANHLVVYAQAAGIPRSRVDDVLGLVGLADAAGRKVGGFSLGMRQRLGLAYALLGDPGILVLDEPANGLDPEGIKWMRGFLRQLAREGRTVLTSSHLLAEVQQTVDSLLVISQGRLVFQGGLDELTDPSEYATVVDAPDRPGLIMALTDAGVSFEVLRSGLTVRGLEPVEVGAIAASEGVALSTLHRRGPALEEVFLDLVNGTRVYPGAAGDALAEAAVAGAALAGAEPAPVEEDQEAPEPTHPGAAPAAAAGAVVAAAAHSDDEPAAGDEAVGADGVAGQAAAAEALAHDAPAAFVVASTGVIDVVSTQTEPDTEGTVPPEAAEPVADGAGEPPQTVDEFADAGIDEDSPGDAAPTESSESERPWEEYVKTDSDLEADAFFAAFDASQAANAARAAEAAAAASESGPGSEPESAAEPGHESGPEAEQAEPQPDVGSDSDPDPEVEPEPHAEQEPESEAHAEQGPDPDPDPAPDGEPDPDPDPDGEPESDGEPDQEPSADPEPTASVDESSADPGSDDEPSEDTSEFGALSDLSPEWVEHDPSGARDNGDEQR